MKFVSLAAAFAIALPSVGRATEIEGAWRPEPNPFRSDMVVTFRETTFTAHIGGYTYGGEYQAEAGRLHFKDVIVIEGGLIAPTCETRRPGGFGATLRTQSPAPPPTGSTAL
jgi:hypothetical protein